MYNIREKITKAVINNEFDDLLNYIIIGGLEDYITEYANQDGKKKTKVINMIDLLKDEKYIIGIKKDFILWYCGDSTFNKWTNNKTKADTFGSFDKADFKLQLLPECFSSIGFIEKKEKENEDKKNSMPKMRE